MIKVLTLDNAEVLAEKLASKGILATPLPQGPVDKLVGASEFLVPQASVGYDKASNTRERLMRGSRAKDITGAQKHDLVLNEYVELVTRTVRGNLDLAKNIVNPLVKDATEEVEAYMAKAESLENNYIDIIPVYMRPIYKAPETEELADRFKSIGFNAIKLELGVDNATDKESLLALALTGAKSYDKKIVKLFNSLDAEFIADVYTRAFSISRVPTSKELLTDIDTAFLVHLWARSLLQTVPSGVNASLSEYKNYMTKLLSQSGRSFLGFIARVDRDITNKRLVIKSPSKHQIGNKSVAIIVRGEVYNQWLKEGGTPETLFGAVCSSGLTTYDKLLEAKEPLEKVWKGRLKLLTTRDRLTKFNIGVEAVGVIVSGVIEDLEDEKLLVDKVTLQNRLKLELTTLHSKFYEDLFPHVRRVICNVIFPHTDALKVLCAIDNVASDFPEMEIKDCALLATVELVGDWIADMINFTKVHPQE